MKHLNIAIALIWRDGRVLATRRPYDADHLPGMWEFPGGKCEAGETPQDCVQREAREELGIDVAIIGEHETIMHAYPERHVTLYPYDCVITNGEPLPIACSELRWLRPEELKADEFPPANSGLIQSLRGKSGI